MTSMKLLRQDLQLAVHTVIQLDDATLSNLGLQSVSMMRESMDPELERVIRHLNSNLKIRNAFENNPVLEEKIEQSLRPAKSLV